MRTWTASAAILIAIASVVGCDKSDDKTAVTTPSVSPPSTMPSAMDKMTNAMSAAKDKAADAKDSAISTATDAKNSAVSAAADAKDTITTKAQEYYDKAKSYISSNNMTGASDMMTKLEAIKAQLPAEWATKEAELKTAFDNAKAKASNMMSSTPAPATQP